MGQNEVVIEVKNGDAIKYVADILVLKHSQALHGLDLKIVKIFSQHNINIHSNINIQKELPVQGEYKIFDSPPNLSANKVMFIGTPTLRNLGYKEIRDFARRTLVFLGESGEEAEEIAVTIHGVGYGLDEEEAFSSQLAGFVDGILKGECPQFLKKIIFIEFDKRRATLLKNLLKDTIPNNVVKKDITNFYRGIEERSEKILREVGYTSDTKEHVFVAMPFLVEMDDVWDYGIKPVVKSAGYICERADLSSYTGDVMDWVKKRIKSAEIVIADLTGSNPNVYLEVGYAWGAGIPTVLLSNEAKDLKFDVQGQRCLVYSRIKDLEKKLGAELKNLKKA